MEEESIVGDESKAAYGREQRRAEEDKGRWRKMGGGRTAACGAEDDRGRREKGESQHAEESKVDRGRKMKEGEGRKERGGVRKEQMLPLHCQRFPLPH